MPTTNDATATINNESTTTNGNQPAATNNNQAEELALMKRKLDEQKAITHELMASAKRSKKSKLNEELMALVRQHVKKITFKTFKFIQTAEQEQMFINAVTDRMKLSEHEGEGNEPAQKRVQFQLLHGKFMKKVLNESRNYVQSQLKNMAYLFMEQNRNTNLPPMKDLLQCLQRKLPISDANEQSIIFYFDYMMPKATGVGEDYNEKIRYYETISKAKSDPDREEVDITPETEAYCLLVVENNYKKWMKLKELDTPELKRNRVLKVQLGKKENHTERDEAKHYYLHTEDHLELSTKYTEPNSGSKDNGGWSMDGARRYAAFRKHAHRARNTAEGQKWEAGALEFLRNKNEITEATHALQQKKKGKRVPGSAAAGATTIEINDLFGEVDDTEVLEDLVEEV